MGTAEDARKLDIEGIGDQSSGSYSFTIVQACPERTITRYAGMQLQIIINFLQTVQRS